MYRLLATLFLVIGGGFLVAVVVQAVFGTRLIDAKALGPAVVLLVVGLLLVWTIRQLPSDATTDTDRNSGAGPATGAGGGATSRASGPDRHAPPERNGGDDAS